MPRFGRPTAEDDRKAQQWAEWFAQRNPLAIASLVLGVFSFIEFGALVIFGVAGIVLGIVALTQLGRTRDRLSDDAANEKPKGFFIAWMGIGLSIASLVIAAILYLRVFG
jgi:hypothetical protein